MDQDSGFFPGKEAREADGDMASRLPQPTNDNLLKPLPPHQDPVRGRLHKLYSQWPFYNMGQMGTTTYPTRTLSGIYFNSSKHSSGTQTNVRKQISDASLRNLLPAGQEGYRESSNYSGGSRSLLPFLPDSQEGSYRPKDHNRPESP